MFSYFKTRWSKIVLFFDKNKLEPDPPETMEVPMSLKILRELAREIWNSDIFLLKRKMKNDRNLLRKHL